MTTTKPIIADPLRLFELGLRNLMDMAILVHIGRCGLIGAQRTSIAEAMRVSYDTARSGVDRLADIGLITCVGRDYKPGGPMNFVCTGRGWALLTQPADFTMFPHAQMALEKQARGKNRRATMEGAA
jgi:hypothetical protein